jgi:hypothetical protein
MTKKAKKEIIQKLKASFAKHLKVSPSLAGSIVPSPITDGKLYEAHVLSRVIENLGATEKLSLTLVGGANMKLKSAPGPINPAYPHIELRRSGSHVANVWTDVEFLALSYCTNGSSLPPTKGHYHELDIVVAHVGATGRPKCNDIWLGVECKNTTYAKGLLKEILGIRRELSFVCDPVKTNFSFWPRTHVPANPPSCLMAYSTDLAVAQYSAPGTMFGIDFVYESL